MNALLADVEVAGVHRMSPSFVRLELAGPALADLWRDGPWWDQRFKLIVPREPGGAVPRAADLPGEGPRGWYTAWLGLPESERGAMRTYSVRGVTGSGRDTRLLVDVVLHPGEHGPGSDWAAAAEVGSRALVAAPRRGHDFGGVEFRPPAASGSHMLLVADESAVPAVASILADWPTGLAGSAYLEVPSAPDVLEDLPRPPGVDITWLARQDGDQVGDLLLDALGHRVGLEDGSPLREPDDAGDTLPWETPDFPGSGEVVEDGPRAGAPDDLHAWVAGESGWVTVARRMLVRELGVDRRRVAFMGYWRRGVAMRA